MMAKRKSSKPAAAEAEILPPAVVIDAALLHGIALGVRRHIQVSTIGSLLEVMKHQAERGQMDCLFVPEVRGLDPLTCCEALQPELHRRGLRTEIVRHTIPRLGLVEEKTALVVSWRKLP